MKILVACEFSGIVREAFKARGHNAWSCDLLPTEIPGQHIQSDVLNNLNDGWDLMIAHPPCTYLTVAGNKWFGKKYKNRFPDREKQLLNSIEFFLLFTKTNIPRVCIENPIGRMSGLYKKPDQIIQPWMFGEPVRKATCLWLKGLPKLEPVKIVTPELDIFSSGNSQSKWHTETGRIKEPQEKSKARSRTFQGIANAMAEQWG